MPRAPFGLDAPVLFRGLEGDVHSGKSLVVTLVVAFDRALGENIVPVENNELNHWRGVAIKYQTAGITAIKATTAMALNAVTIPNLSDVYPRMTGADVVTAVITKALNPK